MGENSELTRLDMPYFYNCHQNTQSVCSQLLKDHFPAEFSSSTPQVSSDPEDFYSHGSSVFNMS